ncbi:MAG: hypothetical protein GAK34_03306 [Delftia tsuruhatensis]|nr:MAG: hypothetical protein GAK34_03306 [Delftia tsuruhatensis]
MGVAGLQLAVDLELVALRGLQSQLRQEGRGLHARCPDTQACGDELAAGQHEPLFAGRLHAAVDDHRNAQGLQPQTRGFGNLFRKTGQQARPGLDQHDAEARGLAQRAVGPGALGQLHQLGRQLHARGAAAHDGHAQLLAAGHAAHHPQADLAVEGIGLAARVDHEAVLVHARRAEIIGAAAHGDHQPVVGNAPARHDLAAIGRLDGGQQHLAGLAVQAAHFAGLVGKAGVAGLGQVGGLLLGQVARAGRNGVQHGLPDMGRIAVHQGHRADGVRAPLAQRRGNLQPRHATAHDDDARPARSRCRTRFLFLAHCCSLPEGPAGRTMRRLAGHSLPDSLDSCQFG